MTETRRKIEEVAEEVRRRDGDRDGQKVTGKWWRKVLLLAVDGPAAEGTQGACVQRFFDRLVELYVPDAPPPGSLGRKLAEATALERFAAETMPALGQPEAVTTTPWAGA